jgi:hypothetical protein
MEIPMRASNMLTTHPPLGVRLLDPVGWITLGRVLGITLGRGGRIGAVKGGRGTSVHLDASG